MILCVSVLSVMISPFSFLILLIRFLSLCFWLMVCQFYLSSQRASFWLCWFLIWSLISFACISALISELLCWRRLLRAPWTARKSNQFILKEISPGCSLERLMLKLKLQYFGHLMRRADWERLRSGGKGDDREWDGWMASPTQWTWVWVDSGSWWWTQRLAVLQFMGSQRVGHDWATELNWLS